MVPICWRRSGPLRALRLLSVAAQGQIVQGLESMDFAAVGAVVVAGIDREHVDFDEELFPSWVKFATFGAG